MKRIAFLPKAMAAGAKEGPRIFNLDHPQTGQPASFVVEGKKLYELLECQRPHSSFFVDNEVIANGASFIAAEFHPLFLVLPFVESRGKKMIRNDQFLKGSPYEDEILADLINPYLPCLCESSFEHEGISLFYDEPKAISWIVSKTEKLSPFFTERLPNSGTDAIIESCFEVMRHFLSRSMRKKVRDALKEKYPGSFQLKMKAPSDSDERAEKQKRTSPFKGRKKQRKGKPEGMRTIQEMFKPTKQ